MKRFTTVAACILLVLSWDTASAQQASPAAHESHKYRTIFTIGGGAGGFALGLALGLSVFDDAVNSERKVTMTTAFATAGGAIGGYFLGRRADKSKTKAAGTTVHLDRVETGLNESGVSPRILNGLRNARPSNPGTFAEISFYDGRHARNVMRAGNPAP